MKKQKAFTLIELMIAMAIIAILATAGLAAYSGYIKKSRDTARAEIASNLNTAVMSYAASNGGNPPAGPDEFTSFLASAGETFGGGNIGGSGNTLLEDPAGGKNVCLDAADAANQPCSFNYTAYDDGTYAISYGVEHESSRAGNFYKTTNSVVAPGEKTQKEATAQTPVAKYGVYIGSAKYIGQDPTTSNGVPNDGVDLINYGTTTSVLFRSIRVDTPVGVSQLASGDTCTQLDTCAGDLSCISSQCRTSNVASGGVCDVLEQCATELVCTSNNTCGTPIALNESCTPSDQCVTGLECSTISNTCKKACGSGTIRAKDDRCWYTMNLGASQVATAYNDAASYGSHYQWGRADTTFTNAPNSPYDWSNPPDPTLWQKVGDIYKNNPCPSGSHVPSRDEWTAVKSAEGITNRATAATSTLKLPAAGWLSWLDSSHLYWSQEGIYWSSSPSGSRASDMYFSQAFADIFDSGRRAIGSSVRCIQD